MWLCKSFKINKLGNYFFNFCTFYKYFKIKYLQNKKILFKSFYKALHSTEGRDT